MCIVDWIIAVSKSSMGGLAFFILIGIVIIFIISVIITNKDKIHTIIIVTIGAFYIFSKVYCGPSLIDVYQMKPMAEKISDYIVKHGIPKSLKDIPDLPYGLEGCKGEQNYYKFDNKEFAYIEVFLKEDAESNMSDEACHFANKGRFYTLKLDKNYVFGVGGDLRIEVENENSETGIQYFFKIDKKGDIHLERKGNPYSSKASGICNPMRQ